SGCIGQVPGTKQFSDSPRLRHTSARKKGSRGIENLCDLPDTRLTQVVPQRQQKGASPFTFVRMNFQPRLDERPDKPTPHGALVVSGVASAQVAVVVGLEVGMVRIEAAQAEG